MAHQLNIYKRTRLWIWRRTTRPERRLFTTLCVIVAASIPFILGADEPSYTPTTHHVYEMPGELAWPPPHIFDVPPPGHWCYSHTYWVGNHREVVWSYCEAPH